MMRHLLYGSRISLQGWTRKVLTNGQLFMSQARNMEGQFLSGDTKEENRTFYRDESLPSLPLPQLKDTLQKYLDSCKAVLNSEQYEKTKSIVEKFGENEGKRLHQQLKQKASMKRNWLEEWWSKMYVEIRAPLVYQNFYGFGDITQIWPLKTGTQLERSSIVLYCFMKFWLNLRNERILGHKSGTGEPLSMDQFRNLFNTCRIPFPKCDELYTGFRTVSEGNCCSHIILTHNKRMYKMQTIDPKTGELYTPPQFHKMFSEIMDRSSLEGVGVSSLTALDRDTWGDVRQHLMRVSDKNKENLKDIETAVMGFTLTDICASSGTELMNLANGKDIPGNRWCGKSFTYMSTKNGAFVCNSDHTPYDGMVFVTLIAYKAALIFDMNGKWTGSEYSGGTEPVEEICFDLDEKLKSWVEVGKNIEIKVNEDVEVIVTNSEQFGKAELKQYKVHPDALIQICFQLAYMRKHGRPAATYETATTRAFYHGRTETCRTCTPETVEFCRAMIQDAPNKSALFQKAYKKFMWLMDQCKSAQGCDRHLFGLAHIAMENGEELPELFKDPAYVTSGGNGNFTLSTSCTGYHVAIGCIAPMKNDGYGMFYRINDSNLYFAISAWNDCQETSAVEIADEIQKALRDVFSLIQNQDGASNL